MQSAQIHPLNAAGFDKTILLMATLIMTRHDEPDYDEKHSDGAPIFSGIRTPHSHASPKRTQRVKLFAA
jgi:hypothetical protein